MNYIRIIFTALLALFGLFCHAQKQVTVQHHGYTLYYNVALKCADSVAWDLDSTLISCNKVTRVDKFAADPSIPYGPKPKDFIQISKDKKLEGAKGHLYSYESAMCNPLSNTDCFFVSQMYWQYQSFNAGDWKTVEVYERELALKGKIHVIAGFIGVAQTLKTGIPIVSYMYKAIYHDGKWEAWIFPNLPTTKGHAYDYWHTTLAELNNQTGLNLN